MAHPINSVTLDVAPKNTWVYTGIFLEPSDGLRVTSTGDTSALLLDLQPTNTPPADYEGTYIGASWVVANYGAGGYVWLRSNANGNVSSTVERLATVERGLPSPIRFVPPGILTAKGASESAFAWMIAIKPKYGAWEGYTSWDVPLKAPQYQDELGNVTPALTYQPNGAELSRIPQSLKLGAQSSDAKVLSPRYSDILNMGATPQVFLPRDKMESGYYVDGYWELFEVMPDTDMSERLCWVCGEIGQVSYDDTQATVELATYEDIVNRTIGDQLHISCQVGARRGEKFGTGRCRNEVLNDGPLRADWTFRATVLAGSAVDAVRVRIGNQSITGKPRDAEFISRLNNGDLEFLSPNDGGGAMAYRQFPLRGGNLISSAGTTQTIEIYPKLALPFVPAAGDLANLVVGCRRIKTDCRYFDNLKNMRASDLPGNDDLNRRTRT